jgi:hypothetical protein
MGDFEVRGFGWRCLFILERWKKPTPTAPEPPLPLNGHAGIFEANGSAYYDDKAVTLGFGKPSPGPSWETQ